MGCLRATYLVLRCLDARCALALDCTLHVVLFDPDGVLNRQRRHMHAFQQRRGVAPAFMPAVATGCNCRCESVEQRGLKALQAQCKLDSLPGFYFSGLSARAAILHSLQCSIVAGSD